MVVRGINSDRPLSSRTLSRVNKRSRSAKMPVLLSGRGNESVT